MLWPAMPHFEETSQPSVFITRCRMSSGSTLINFQSPPVPVLLGESPGPLPPPSSPEPRIPPSLGTLLVIFGALRDGLFALAGAFFLALLDLLAVFLGLLFFTVVFLTVFFGLLAFALLFLVLRFLVAMYYLLWLAN